MSCRRVALLLCRSEVLLGPEGHQPLLLLSVSNMPLPTQGVMLSERPSASLGVSVATQGGGAPLAGAGSIGNYKGVMLCNRPFAGVAAAAKGGEVAAAAGKHAFLTGKVKTEIGFAGKNLNAETLLRKRVKRETALTRHRRWLADLQLTKETLEEQYMEDLRRKEKSKKRFAERESRMRQMTRELALGEGKSTVQGSDEQGGKAWSIGLDEDENHTAGKGTTDHLRPAQGGGENQLGGEGDEEEDKEDARSEEGRSRVDPAELRAVEKRRKRDGKPCRPKWAMTEAKAEAEDELKHEEELEELLAFTKGLDFGRYIRDAEVQSMIDQVKKRIAEIERQPEVDDRAVGDDGDDDAGSSGRDEDPMDEAEVRLEAKIMKLTDKNLRDAATLHESGNPTSGDCDYHQEDDNISIARTALSEGGRSVRSIHSTRSLAALAEKARVGIATARTAGGGTAPARLEEGATSGLDTLDEEMAVNDIVVVTHQDDGGLRLGGKNTVSNLPYIRRNPAL